MTNYIHAEIETDDIAGALQLAILFHETYERLAPGFGYETRTETRKFDPATPNGRLMIAVCGEILNKINFPDGVCFHGIPLDEECRECAMGVPAV